MRCITLEKTLRAHQDLQRTCHNPNQHLQVRMFSRLVQICVLLTVCGVSSALTCRWIHHKFKQHNSECMSLLKDMKEEDISTNASFPEKWLQWFHNHSRSQSEKQIWFMTQTLEEVTRLLENANVTWSEEKLDTFLNMLQQQVKGLRSCLTQKMNRSKRLLLYFKHLRDLTQDKRITRNEAWEQIRTELLQLFKLLEFFPAFSLKRVALHDF